MKKSTTSKPWPIARYQGFLETGISPGKDPNIFLVDDEGLAKRLVMLAKREYKTRSKGDGLLPLRAIY